MADRTYTCPDCGPAIEHTARSRGPIPTRCRKHLIAAKNRRARRDRRGFRVVDQEPALEIPLVDDTAAAVPAAAEPEPISVIVRRELDGAFLTHPAAESLTATALILARQLEHPMTLVDGRITATVARELRATLETLTARQEVADVVDPFGLGAVPASVGNASAS